MIQESISKSIIKSQHCQRNWDLTKEIPQEDMSVLVTAATQCPSKQNIAYYKLHFITNRDVIERIHSYTNGFVVKLGTNTEPATYTTNPQTLANLVIVFEDYLNLSNLSDKSRNDQTRAIGTKEEESARSQINFDKHVAVGVAAGYLNLTASMLGYSTGCCSCMDHSSIKSELSLENSPLLMMGIGFKDESRNRRIHQNSDYVFPTKPKQPIQVNFIK
jgi:nitroreductase